MHILLVDFEWEEKKDTYKLQKINTTVKCCSSGHTENDNNILFFSASKIFPSCYINLAWQAYTLVVSGKTSNLMGNRCSVCMHMKYINICKNHWLIINARRTTSNLFLIARKIIFFLFNWDRFSATLKRKKNARAIFCVHCY